MAQTGTAIKYHVKKSNFERKDVAYNYTFSFGNISSISFLKTLKLLIFFHESSQSYKVAHVPLLKPALRNHKDPLFRMSAHSLQRTPGLI